MTTLCGPIATAHPPATSGSVTVPSVLRATLQTIRRANESLRQQQDDSQWRKLLGEQQMQFHQRPTGWHKPSSASVRRRSCQRIYFVVIRNTGKTCATEEVHRRNKSIGG